MHTTTGTTLLVTLNFTHFYKKKEKEKKHTLTSLNTCVRGPNVVLLLLFLLLLYALLRIFFFFFDPTAHADTAVGSPARGELQKLCTRCCLLLLSSHIVVVDRLSMITPERISGSQPSP